MGIELGILFAFCALLSWAFGDFLIQRSARKVGDVQALAVIGIVGTIGIFPFIIKDLKLLGNTDNLLLLSFLGIIVFIDALLNFEALKEGKLSIIDVVMELELPVTVALSFFFFKEYLSPLQTVMIISVLLGIILIATKSFSHWKTRMEKGVWLALVTAILMGVVNFTTASSSKQISPLMAVWFPWTILTILTLIIIWKREGFENFTHNLKEHSLLLLMTGILDTTAWIFYSFAVYHNQISIITAITESYPAVAMFLGLWLNKESIKWHQYLGAGLALIGSILLSMTV